MDIPIGIPIPFVFEPSMEIPSQNTKLKNYVKVMFIFVDYFLLKRCGALLFFLDDLHVFKEISSFLDSDELSIKMKWVVINSLPLVNTKNRSQHVFPIVLFYYNSTLQSMWWIFLIYQFFFFYKFSYIEPYFLHGRTSNFSHHLLLQLFMAFMFVRRMSFIIKQLEHP